MKAAQAKGRLRGKQPKFSATKEAHVTLYRNGEYTVSGLSVSRSTVYRAIERRDAREA